MKWFRPTRFTTVVLLLAVLLAAGAPALQAQSSFILSKSDDFSTDDRVFARSDVLHMLVTAPQIDFNDLDKNEFRLKPDDGGNDIRGVFTNHFDGTYTASVPLDSTDPNESDWELRMRIEDDDGNEFEARVDLQIGDDDEEEEEDEEEDEEDEEDEDEVELTGTIEALGEGSITVNGITFVVTEETVILDDDNNPITFDDLGVGMTVEIRGERDAAGVLVATDIKIEDEDEDDEDEVEFTGTVESLDAGSITVDGITFVVTDETVILDDDNNAITFDDLAVGMIVEIRGERDADGVLVATDIKIEDEDEDDEDEVEFTGTVESLDAGSITVGGITFVVTEETVILDDDNNPITFDDLAVGMIVEIRGERDAAGVLVATDIKIEDDDDGEEDDEVEFIGTIGALDDGSITVGGITFVVTEETVILDDDNNPITLDDLAVGMVVEIRGERGADGVLIATDIKIEDPPAAAGRIGTMEDDRLTVEERTFLIDDDTRVLDANAAPISFFDLEIGLRVEVYARADAASMPVAAQVKVVGEGDVAAALEEAESDVPDRFALGQNYPNPFNPETTISFELVKGAREQVSLVIYNILGEAVRTLVQGELGPGRYQYAWDARNHRGDPVASGLYLYRLRVGDQVQTRRMVLLK